MIKTLIYIDVFLIFLSLGSALYFLIVDQGKVESKRTAQSWFQSCSGCYINNLSYYRPNNRRTRK